MGGEYASPAAILLPGDRTMDGSGGDNGARIARLDAKHGG
jgi:hypothetical protein